MADEHEDNHGQTPAAWTTVIIIMVAAVVATLGLVVGSWPVFWIGIALVVVGAVVGKVMAMAGLGKPATAEHEHGGSGHSAVTIGDVAADVERAVDDPGAR